MNLRQGFSFIKTKLQLKNKEFRGFYRSGDTQITATVKLGDGSVVAVGDFIGFIDTTGINHQAINIIKFLPNGTVDTTFLNNIGTGFNNTVQCIETDGTNLYIGGSFTSFNGTPSVNRIAKLSLDGVLDNTFKSNNSGFSSTVRSIAILGGSLYIGGDFTSKVAKLSTSGATQSFVSGIENNVYAVATDGISIYVGGDFNNAGGAILVGRIAKYSTGGGFDNSFYNAYASGFNSTVRSIKITGGSLYIGGSFTSFNGVANNARYIAKLSTSGIFDSTFSNNLDVVSGTKATTSGFDNAVHTIETDGTSLYVGGTFTSLKGIANNARKIAKLSTSGVFDTTFSNNLDVVSGTKATTSGFDDFTANSIRSIVLDGTSLIVGGTFTSLKNSAAISLTKISTLGLPENYITSAYLFSPLTGVETTTGILDSVGNRYIANNSHFNGRSIGGIVKILPNGELDETFFSNIGSGFNSYIHQILIIGTNLYVVGNFTSFKGTANNANRIAKLSTSGVFDTTFSNNLDVVSGTKATNSGFNGTAHALATDGTNLYVGGAFTQFKSTSSNARRIAKLSTSGVFDTTFSNNLDVVSGTKATTSGFNSTVNSLLVVGTSLYVGGIFTSFKGTANNANGIAKLTTAGIFDSTFSNNLDVVSGTKATTSGFGGGAILKIITDGTNLYVGGAFTQFKGIAHSARYIAKLSTSGVFDTAFSDNLDVVSGTKALTSGFGNQVNDILIVENNLYIGGNFLFFKQTPISRIAKLNTSGVFDTDFHNFIYTSEGLANGFNSTVRTLLYDYKYSSLVVCGEFKNFKNEPSWGLYTISLNT